MPSGEVPVILNGAVELQALAKRMKRAEPALRKEFYVGLARAARPMREAVQAEARRSLPSGGCRGKRKTRTNRSTGDVSATTGFKTGDTVAARAAGASYVIRATQGKNPTVTLKAVPRKGKSVDLKALDRGRLRHSLFGNKRHWYGQAVTPGWFSRPVDRQVGNVRTELLKAIDDTKRQLDL